jgi:hypothetical protein
MRTAAAAPYLLPPEDAVTPELWRTPDGVELADRLEHWDPFTDVHLARAMTVDTDSIRRGCQLPEDASFALIASWRSDRTRLAGSGAPVELGVLGGTLRAPLALVVPGPSAGGRVELRTSLVLRTPGTDPTVISPKRGGSILWTDARTIAFEGSAARFPLTAIDFSSVQRLPEAGLWALEWDEDDLEAPVSASLRLLLNAGEATLLDAVRSGSNDPRAISLRSFITYDIARTLVEGALSNERFVDGPELFDDGTLGRMLFELLSACWPGIPVPALRRRMLEDQARLHAELQAHLAVLT